MADTWVGRLLFNAHGFSSASRRTNNGDSCDSSHPHAIEYALSFARLRRVPFTLSKRFHIAENESRMLEMKG